MLLQVVEKSGVFLCLELQKDVHLQLDGTAYDARRGDFILSGVGGLRFVTREEYERDYKAVFEG